LHNKAVKLTIKTKKYHVNNTQKLSNKKWGWKLAEIILHVNNTNFHPTRYHL